MANNLRHQPGHMYIAGTVTFVPIYYKITKSANAALNQRVHKNMSILLLSFTKKCLLNMYSSYFRYFDRLCVNY